MTTKVRIDPKVSQETYDRILKRYEQFLENAMDQDKPVIRVFDPLTPHQMAELETTRQMSRELQLKKDADMKKSQEDKEASEKAKEDTEKEIVVEEKKD